MSSQKMSKAQNENELSQNQMCRQENSEVVTKNEQRCEKNRKLYNRHNLET